MIGRVTGRCTAVRRRITGRCKLSGGGSTPPDGGRDNVFPQ